MNISYKIIYSGLLLILFQTSCAQELSERDEFQIENTNLDSTLSLDTVTIPEIIDFLGNRRRR